MRILGLTDGPTVGLDARVGDRAVACLHGWLNHWSWFPGPTTPCGQPNTEQRPTLSYFFDVIVVTINWAFDIRSCLYRLPSFSCLFVLWCCMYACETNTTTNQQQHGLGLCVCRWHICLSASWCLCLSVCLSLCLSVSLSLSLSETVVENRQPSVIQVIHEEIWEQGIKSVRRTACEFAFKISELGILNGMCRVVNTVELLLCVKQEAMLQTFLLLLICLF